MCILCEIMAKNPASFNDADALKAYQKTIADIFVGLDENENAKQPAAPAGDTKPHLHMEMMLDNEEGETSETGITLPVIEVTDDETNEAFQAVPLDAATEAIEQLYTDLMDSLEFAGEVVTTAEEAAVVIQKQRNELQLAKLETMKTEKYRGLLMQALAALEAQPNTAAMELGYRLRVQMNDTKL